jgi:hypothetical protein
VGLAVLLLGATAAAPAFAVAASPPQHPSVRVAAATVTGPVTGGVGHPSLTTTSFDLATVGYTSTEYFVAGTAHSYTPTAPLKADGKWKVASDANAAYKTRIVVYRPADAKRFNGTVVVEWFNESAGFDSSPDWILAHNELIRDGYAYVGVSAQQLGVSGGGALIGGLSGYGKPLTAADPDRYGSLVHPGDSFSYDIYSQVGAALRNRTGTQPLGGLTPKTVIGVGESQSAFRMVTYVNAVQPRDRVYDGFLIHSRFGTGADISQAPQPDVKTPAATRVRADLGVPVLTLETESDVVPLGFLPARQPDSKRFRLWEVAGTAHADAYTIGGIGDPGDGAAVAALLNTPSFGLACPVPVNSGPGFAIVSAAIVQLNRWIRTGTPPPTAARLAVANGAYVVDAHGNTRGGVRTPFVDVPTGTLSSGGQTSNVLCKLFGSTARFDPVTLASLYPTHAAYVGRFTASANQAVKAGFIRPDTARQLIAAARQSDVGTAPVE